MTTRAFSIVRAAGLPAGAFGVFRQAEETFALTLERTYDAPPQSCCHAIAPGQWAKLPPGRYRCTRSSRQDA